MNAATARHPVRSFSEPTTIADAIDLKVQGGDRAVFVAGGTDIGVMLRRNVIQPAHLISLRRVDELSTVTTDDHIRIGASVTHRQIERAPEFSRELRALQEASATVGSIQTRNVGTVAGNLANASPAADTPPVLLTLGARIILEGPSGRRDVPLDAFFTGYRQTAAHPDEMIVEIVLPPPAHNSGTAFTKLGRRRAMEISIACVAAKVTLDGDGRFAEAAIGLGAVAPTPVRATAAEAVLTGESPTDDVLAAAGHAATEASSPIDDQRGSAAYRRSVLGVLVRRTLAEAVRRAGGNQ